jgi:hypothetical protein
MTNITIDVVFAIISDDYEPTDTELLILQDIVRDLKSPKGYTFFERGQSNRASIPDADSVSIMEIFDYKVKIDPDRLIKLRDKQRLCINNRGKKKYLFYQFRKVNK